MLTMLTVVFFHPGVPIYLILKVSRWSAADVVCWYLVVFLSADDRDLGMMTGTIQSEADIRAFLPSKHQSLKRTTSSEATTLRKRKSKRGASVKTLHPPSRGPSMRSMRYYDSADGGDSDESELDEEERQHRLQQIKSLTSSLDTKRQAR